MHLRDVLELRQPHAPDVRVAPLFSVTGGPTVVHEDDREAVIDPRLHSRIEGILVVCRRPAMDDEDRGMRSLAGRFRDKDVHAVDVEIAEGDAGGRGLARRPQNDPATEGVRRGRCARAGQLVPDIAIGVHARGDDRAGLRGKPLESSCPEVVAIELGPAAVFVSDEERLSIRIPVGERLARQVELDIVDRRRGRIEDERLAPAAAVVEREKPLIACDKRPRDWLQA